ncbi:MAG: outer membrane lipoprotein-sorting protein [Endomicrobiales bacterium]|nr:outer membrane lipoprotein-sorting protein [Endomicrobiales bacterium]
MRKIFISFIVIFCRTLLFALTADEILDKMDDVRDYKTAKMNATMKIINRDGHTTSMSLISYEKTGEEEDMSLMRFTEPARLKGTAILTVGDNIWYYNNRTNRVRLLSKSAKKGSMMGSSFSYEDMDMNYVDDYTAEIEKETDKEYVLKIIPKDKDKTYKYLLADVRKDDFIATKVEYYNKNDLKYKELISKDIVNIGGHLVALFVSMKEIGSQKITNFEMKEDSAEFDLRLDDKLFSERYLKK